MQPAAEKAARQHTAAAAAAMSVSNSSSVNISSREAAEQLYRQPAAPATTAPQQRKKGPYTVHCKISKIVVLIKGNAPKKFKKDNTIINKCWPENMGTFSGQCCLVPSSGPGITLSHLSFPAIGI